MKQQLFSFIHQLNKQEKRYFKLYASQLAGEDGNMYTYLFDLVESSENIDEEYIKNEYCKRLDIKTYISTKFYLKLKLLETLRLMQVHTQPTVEQEIQQLMENAALFYQKSFSTLCEREILKAEKLAEEAEYWDLLYSIIEKKLSIYYDIFMNEKNNSLDAVKRMIEKKNNALINLRQNNDILNIIYEIKVYLKRWDLHENKSHIEQLLSADIMQNEPNGIIAKINFYLAKAIIYKYLINNEMYAACYKKVFEFWQQSQTIKLSDIKGYLMQSSNCITALIIAKKLQEAEAVLAQLQKEIPQLKKHTLDQQEVYPPIFHAQKVIYLHAANYSELIGMEKKVAPFLVPGNPYYPKTTIIEMHYALCYAYFKTRNYDKSLNHANVILHDKDMLIHCTLFYIYCFFAVYLLCHYELGNLNFLIYEIDRQKDITLKLNANDDISNVFFKLLKKMCKYPDVKKANLLKYLPIFQTYEKENPKSTVFLSVADWIQGQLVRN